jgi:hypothetical protein
MRKAATVGGEKSHAPLPGQRVFPFLDGPEDDGRGRRPAPAGGADRRMSWSPTGADKRTMDADGGRQEPAGGVLRADPGESAVRGRKRP